MEDCSHATEFLIKFVIKKKGYIGYNSPNKLQ